MFVLDMAWHGRHMKQVSQEIKYNNNNTNNIE